MALRMVMLRSSGAFRECGLGLRRFTHAMAQPAAQDSAVGNFTNASLPMVLPNSENSNDNPCYSFFHGSMELMAVPKRKVSPHKRGIRNGPKALKPVPVIIRCKVCGRVKLPHFFCCSGIKLNPEEQNGSTS